jgi:hypothetical protein
MTFHITIKMIQPGLKHSVCVYVYVSRCDGRRSELAAQMPIEK